MRALMTVLSMAALLAVSGCTSSPPKGQGGFAEHNLSNMPEHPVGLESALYFEQQLSRRHLDALLAAGANICFPAAVRTAQIRQTRIARELQGGLDSDAADDLIIQRDKLNRLERRLNYVQMQETCLPNQKQPQETTDFVQAQALSKEQLELIMSLLNNNNQFVFNSSQLNPRYIAQLAEVTLMLRAHPQYHLKLTGHADSQGSKSANLKLSLERASQVERYLQIFGLAPGNILVDGSGAADPLFAGSEPQVRLVNRRVSIELINTNNSQQEIQQ
ncbi:OmpA family protein [Psychromonas ossibalaenae]|uniref:OmpA family protein n=1 Tax=Psychromonas ossibalaenae TaxID=444922 RepID=UPI00038161A3|nr:OmpA family protein [Psychromonas ossibalaenae]